MDTNDPTVPAVPPPESTSPSLAPPEPPKELASLEDKALLLRDVALMTELSKKVRERVKGDEEQKEVLQDVLFAISRAPVPKARDEWQPYCKTIADNMAKTHAAAMQNKPLTRAVSLDDDVQGDMIQRRTRTPEAILRDKEAVGFVLGRAGRWGKHRGWFRSSEIDGESHATIAARAGVAPETVANTMTLKRKDVDRWKNLLVYILGLMGMPILIKNMLYRHGTVSASRDHLGNDASGILTLILFVVGAVAIFAAVARRARTRRPAVIAAIVASIAFAAHQAYWGDRVYGDELGTFPDNLTDLATFVMYGTQALVFVGAGGLLARTAAKRFGFMGFLGVLALVVPVALFVSVVQILAFHWPNTHGDIWEILMEWEVRLAPLYAFVWWMGREPRAVSADRAEEGVAARDAAATLVTAQAVDEGDSAAAE